MENSNPSLNLRFVEGRYSIARLPGGSAIPGWATGPGFSAIVIADDEVTIVCSHDRVPEGIESSHSWSCLRTIGPIAFQTTGVVRSLVSPLSSNKIGVFVVCTFDGEHLLIAEHDRCKAVGILTAAGHRFVT